MLTGHELDRIRRQMNRRIRVVLAQRRTDAAQDDQRTTGGTGSADEGDGSPGPRVGPPG